MKKAAKVIGTIGVIILIVTGIFLAWRVLTAQDNQGPGDTEAKKCSLPARYTLYGFNQFTGQFLTGEGDEFLHLKDITLIDFSGYSVPWDNNPFDLEGCNTLVVEVKGSSTIKTSVQKMMKWFIQFPGVSADVTLICSQKKYLSAGFPEFVVPLDERFEYPLPEDAVKKGLTKIGITLFDGASYGDVEIKVYFVRK